MSPLKLSPQYYAGMARCVEKMDNRLRAQSNIMVREQELTVLAR
ncbi:hypothetical protein TVNIR_1209 [Thioalkalivibrio nitratireducens DSM 14787]|uniref:Uncharacterized protein n=1 Tax=Thioalkalivibrio nitratireducens (strain DSM 14787 / UNIQEM 213 / ALEN2) TaxID=1255043 RepID=L0DV40_THIND|nr:hypothetical protein TVNIR_1209 [Thioalkalivibrio nitratireducens DSM 14787]